MNEASSSQDSGSGPDIGSVPAVLPRAIVLMGVCGCGKTEVGQQLAKLTGGIYLDGDDYHSPENIAKMGRGEPLVDDDRWPWLQKLHDDVIAPAVASAEPGSAPQPQPVILGCSALRRVYREALSGTLERGSVWFVHLDGAEELILERMRMRKGHYMKEGMIASQLAILEKPDIGESAIRVSIEPAPDAIAREIMSQLAARTQEPA